MKTIPKSEFSYWILLRKVLEVLIPANGGGLLAAMVADANLSDTWPIHLTGILGALWRVYNNVRKIDNTR